MKNNHKISKTLFFLAVLLQILILFSILIAKEISIRSGNKIIVKAIPVDPRSLFRGDYVYLNYRFSRINLQEVKSSSTYYRKGQTVYVTIIEQGDDWKPIYISDKVIDDINEIGIVIRGTVGRWVTTNYLTGNYLPVVYGVESYFIPEGQGKHVEHQISRLNVKVELSIDKKGYASATKIFINDKEVKFR